MTQFQKSNLCGSEKKGKKNQGLQIYKTEHLKVGGNGGFDLQGCTEWLVVSCSFQLTGELFHSLKSTKI